MIPSTSLRESGGGGQALISVGVVHSSDHAKSQMPSNSPGEEKHCKVCALGAGACAGAASVLVGQPFDTLKVRMQIASHGSAPPKQHKMGGILQMYRGFLPPLMTSGFVSSLNFIGFETVKNLFPRQENSLHPLYV